MRPAALRQRQLERGEEALRALRRYGSPKRAAEKLGIKEGTINTRIRVYCSIQGFEHPVQAAFALAEAQNDAQINAEAA